MEKALSKLEIIYIFMAVPYPLREKQFRETWQVSKHVMETQVEWAEVSYEGYLVAQRLRENAE